jgi:flagellar basal body-associated protein FliL
MKRFAALALAVLTTFGFVAAANAQTAVAPLVTKDATTIVRVDLSQIDASQLSQTTQKLVGAAVDYFVADAEKAQELKETSPLL